MDELQASESAMDSSAAAVSASEAVQESAQAAQDAAQAVDLSDVHDGIQGLQLSLDTLVEGYRQGQDALQTLLTGLVSVQMYTLLAQLVVIGLLCTLVFVIALRRL